MLELIKVIKKLKSGGLSNREIAEKLNEQGFKTKQGKTFKEHNVRFVSLTGHNNKKLSIVRKHLRKPPSKHEFTSIKTIRMLTSIKGESVKTKLDLLKTYLNRVV
jgi:DNA-binding transcriptional MerR regulator